MGLDVQTFRPNFPTWGTMFKSSAELSNMESDVQVFRPSWPTAGFGTSSRPLSFHSRRYANIKFADVPVIELLDGIQGMISETLLSLRMRTMPSRRVGVD